MCIISMYYMLHELAFHERRIIHRHIIAQIIICAMKENIRGQKGREK